MTYASCRNMLVSKQNIHMFDIPKIVPHGLMNKVYKYLGAEDIYIKLEFSDFGSYTLGFNSRRNDSTLCNQVSLRVMDGTEMHNVISVFEKLLKMGGKNPEKEPARIHDLTIYGITPHNDNIEEDFRQAVLNDKRIKFEYKSNFPYVYEPGLVGTLATGDIFMLQYAKFSRQNIHTSRLENGIGVRIFSESGWGSGKIKSKLADLKLLNEVLDDIIQKMFEK